MKLSIWKYFSKLLLRNFNHLQGFRPVYIMSGPFRAIPSICNQRSLNGPKTSFVWSILSHIFTSYLICPDKTKAAMNSNLIFLRPMYDFKRSPIFQLFKQGNISWKRWCVFLRIQLRLDISFCPIVLDLLSYEGLQRLYQPQKLCGLADLEDAM